MESATLDGMIPVIHREGYDAVWSALCRAAADYCRARVHGALAVETIMMDAGGEKIGGSGSEFEP